MQPKRLITSLLVAILILSLAVLSIAAEESSAFEMAVEVSTSTAVYNSDGNPVLGIGDTIQVSVVIKNNPGLSAVCFFVDYDNTVLKPETDIKGNLIFTEPDGNLLKMTSDDGRNVTLVADNETGNQKVQFFFLGSKLSTANGTLFTVSFKVINDSEDSIDIKLAARAGNNIIGADSKPILFDSIVKKNASVESHEYELGEVHAPTCTKEGYTEAVCKNCPEKAEPDRVNIKPALGHEPGDLIAEKPATCEEKGLLAHYICKREGCGKLLVKDGEEIKEATAEDFVIEAKGHKYGDLIAAKDATCTEKGNKAYYQCSECKKYFDSEKVETAFDKIVIDALGHDYVTHEQVNPTCTADGMKAYFTCKNCDYLSDKQGDTEKHTTDEYVISKLGHDEGKEDDTGCPATCTDAGKKPNIVCTRCGYILKEGAVIPAGDGEHKFEFDHRVAPTCTEDGYAVYVCSYCKEEKININDGDAVPKLGHSLGESIPGKEATCTEDGYAPYQVCTRCYNEETQTGYSTYTVIPALGHDWDINVAQPATCTKDGWFEYSQCKRKGCTEGTKKVIIPALGHALQHVDAVAPTCEDIGWDNYDYCTRCDYTTYVELPALGHKMVKVEAKEATCEEDGYKAYAYCENCYFDAPDAVKIEIIPALGHNIVAISTVSPECEKTGYVYYECLNHCGYDETVITDALGHDVRVTETLLPTCTTDGYVKQACAREGCDLESQITIKATGHVIVDVPAVAATCTANGMTAGKQCTVCGVYTEESSVVAAEGHKYVELPIAATCTNQGFTVKTCSVCAAVALDNFIPALGHDYVVAKTEASCTGDGFTTYTCSKCADKYVADITNALGHKPGAAATCNSNQTCQTCGAVLAEAKDHELVRIDEKKPTKKDPNGYTEHYKCVNPNCDYKVNYEKLTYEGCGSVIGGCGAIVSLVAILGGAWITSKKKH